MKDHEWKTLSVIVEVRVQGDRLKEKDLRWGVENVLSINDPFWTMVKHQPAERRPKYGKLRIKSFSKVAASAKRKS